MSIKNSARTDISGSVSFTPGALVASITSASVSSLSSLFVIIFILRSRNKLNGAYHRIMFFMCFWDLISSLAIAATTLPMPSDVHDVYSFSGAAYGTVATCEFQALMILLGSGFTIFSNCALNIFYICTIRWGMSDAKFKRIIFPSLLAAAIVCCVPWTILFFSREILNPVPSYPYCLAGSYPYDCNLHDEVECIRGGGASSTENGLEITMSISLAMGFLVVLLSMILVISTLYKTEMEVRRNASEGEGESDHEDSGNNSRSTRMRSECDFMETRIALRLGLMYIAAFLLTWGPTVVFIMASRGSKDDPRPKISDYLMFIFQPLQGFFNALVFVYSKIIMLRRSNRNLKFCQAVKTVIVSPESIPDIIVTRLELVLDRDEEASDHPVIEEEPSTTSGDISSDSLPSSNRLESDLLHTTCTSSSTPRTHHIGTLQQNIVKNHAESKNTEDETSVRPSTCESREKKPNKYSYYDMSDLEDMFPIKINREVDRTSTTSTVEKQISSKKVRSSIASDSSSTASNMNMGQGEGQSGTNDVSRNDGSVSVALSTNGGSYVNCDDTTVIRSGAGYHTNALTDFESLATPFDDMSLSDGSIRS